MSKDYFTIPIEAFGKEVGDLHISVYATEELLRESVKGFPNYHDDTIAYSDTYTLEENRDVVGRIYVVLGVEAAVIAHECVHISLGILNRLGYTTMPITAEDAPDVEEKLASLVGGLTGLIAEDLQIYGTTVRANTKVSRKLAPLAPTN